MANPFLNDQFAFRPNGGGKGVRLAVSANAATTPTNLPGSGDASDASNIVRVRVSCGGAGNACVAFNGTADSTFMEVQAGTVEMFTLPFNGSNGITISAYGISAATTIQATTGGGF